MCLLLHSLLACLYNIFGLSNAYTKLLLSFNLIIPRDLRSLHSHLAFSIRSGDCRFCRVISYANHTASLTISSSPCHRDCMRLELSFIVVEHVEYRSKIFRQVQEHGMKFLLSEHYVGTLYLAAGSLPYSLDTISLFFLHPSLVFQSMSARYITSIRHFSFMFFYVLHERYVPLYVKESYYLDLTCETTQRIRT